MSKISKCLLKINKKTSVQIVEEKNETTIKYFTVANDGKIFSDNAHTIGGYKGFYRTIICVPTDLDEFNGI